MERLADALVPRRLHTHREQVHYLAVGAWNTVFGYANFAALYYFLHATVHVTLILVISYVLSIANAYVCYRFIVFRSHGSMTREVPRFAGVYIIALAANLVVLPVALRWLPLNAYAVQAFFTVGVVALSYVGHKYFSFRGGRLEEGPADVGEAGQGNTAARQTSHESRPSDRE